MNSLCYLALGLVLVRETNLLRLASGINNINSYNYKVGNDST